MVHINCSGGEIYTSVVDKSYSCFGCGAINVPETEIVEEVIEPLEVAKENDE